MIISGGSRSNYRFFAKHLMRVDENERVEIREIRGLAGDTVLEVLREMDALASGTRCKNSFYHANLNPRADEVLTPGQWEQAVDTLEHELGLDGQSRFVVVHNKEGREHIHVIWSRIDVDTMTAVPDSMNYAAHERAARALEETFGHAPVVGAHGNDGKRPKRRPKNWETFRGHDSGLDPQDITREVTALWQHADSGKAFAASLAAHGYQLCKGDRRDFCLMDATGDVHSLARRIDGAKAAEIRARMADIDRESLPSAADAKPIVAPAAVIDETPLSAPEPFAAIPGATVKAPDVQNSVALSALDMFANDISRSSRPIKPHEPKADIDAWWNHPVSAPPVLEQGVSLLDHFARTIAKVMKRNDGEPMMDDGLSWIERRVASLTVTSKQLVDWVIGSVEDLAAHFRSAEAPEQEIRDRDIGERGLDR